MGKSKFVVVRMEKIRHAGYDYYSGFINNNNKMKTRRKIIQIIQ
jgi:hypothetical protein